MGKTSLKLPEPKKYTEAATSDLFKRWQFCMLNHKDKANSVFAGVFGSMQAHLESPSPKHRFAARLFFEKIDDMLREIDPEKNIRSLKTVPFISLADEQRARDLRADLDPTSG